MQVRNESLALPPPLTVTADGHRSLWLYQSFLPVKRWFFFATVARCLQHQPVGSEVRETGKKAWCEREPNIAITHD